MPNFVFRVLLGLWNPKNYLPLRNPGANCKGKKRNILKRVLWTIGLTSRIPPDSLDKRDIRQLPLSVRPFVNTWELICGCSVAQSCLAQGLRSLLPFPGGFPPTCLVQWADYQTRLKTDWFPILIQLGGWLYFSLVGLVKYLMES